MKILFICSEANVHMKRLSDALAVQSVVTMLELPDERKIALDPAREFDLIVISPLDIEIENLEKKYDGARVLGISMGFDLHIATENEKVSHTVRKIINIANKILVDCEYSKNILENSYKYNSSSIEVIPYGADIEDLVSMDLPSGSPSTIAVTRNWTELHGNEVILKALGLVKNNFAVTFAGSGPILENMKAKYSNLSNVKYVGSLDFSRLKNLLSKNAIYVSAARSDGSSISLIEAMAAGRICCVSDFSSNLEWIENGRNGFVFKNGCPDSLAQVLDEISGMEINRLEGVCREARRTAINRGNWKVNADKFRMFAFGSSAEAPEGKLKVWPIL